MLNKLLALLFVVVMVGAVNGCGSSGSSSSASSEPTPATKPSIPIPADSPFAKIKNGMDFQQVSSLIGQPTSQYSYITGKAFIPFHFSGSDDHRMDWRYKGMGVITFSNDSAYSSGMSVMEIDYNPNETGYAPSSN